MRFGPPGFSRTMASRGRGAGGSRAMLGEKRCWQEGRDVDAGTGKRRKSGLTRDGIVDAAYRMIDRDGMGAFTMRALGAELGVSAMAFYAPSARIVNAPMPSRSIMRYAASTMPSRVNKEYKNGRGKGKGKEKNLKASRMLTLFVNVQ